MNNNDEINNIDFKLYNNCLISKLAPDEIPNIDNIKNIVNKNGYYLARWTDKFDEIKNNDNWWYLIKDGKWDLNTLKSHDRNEIKKGIKNFDCKIISPHNYLEQLYNVYIKASNEYSSLSNNIISFDEYKKSFNDNHIIIGAFDKEDNSIAAYSIVFYYESKNRKKSNSINLSVMKIDPDKKRKSPSAALMNYICDYYLNEKKVDYICDGEKAIRHITNFQKYLEKYFGFRKVYCRLNIIYNKKIEIVIKVLYPFKRIIKFFSNKTKKIYNLYVILQQEQIVRSYKKGDEKNV